MTAQDRVSYSANWPDSRGLGRCDAMRADCPERAASRVKRPDPVPPDGDRFDNARSAVAQRFRLPGQANLLSICEMTPQGPPDRPPDRLWALTVPPKKQFPCRNRYETCVGFGPEFLCKTPVCLRRWVNPPRQIPLTAAAGSGGVPDQWIWPCTVAVSSLSENGLGRNTEFGIRALVSLKLSSA